MDKKHKFSTLVIHAGEEEDSPFGAAVTPIFQTSTFAFKNTAEVIQYQEGDPSKYLYTRYGNPTLEAVEKKMATLEGGEAALLVSSGMAAVSTIALTLVASGEEIISPEPVYGGTAHLFKDVFAKLGIKVHFIDPLKMDQAESLLNQNTKLAFCETPTNPNLRIVDVKKLVDMGQNINIYQHSISTRLPSLTHA